MRSGWALKLSLESAGIRRFWSSWNRLKCWALDRSEKVIKQGSLIFLLVCWWPRRVERAQCVQSRGNFWTFLAHQRLHWTKSQWGNCWHSHNHLRISTPASKTGSITQSWLTWIWRDHSDFWSLGQRSPFLIQSWLSSRGNHRSQSFAVITLVEQYDLHDNSSLTWFNKRKRKMA